MDQETARKEMHRAYELIKQGQKEAAFDILFPMTEEFEQNAALWWLLAHSLIGRSDEDAVVALENMLDLQPGHEPGQRLLRKLNS